MDVLILKRTSDMQFSIKDKHSTSLATSVVLKTVDCYCYNGGAVYGCVLDVTMAFDTVKHAELFEVTIK